MANPVLVEATRGALVETRHRGAVAVLDADGHVVWSVGDIDRPVFPRSAVKLIQALPLVESGAADRYALTDTELALACASHSAEPGHIATASSMLEKAGLREENLECGCHWPLFSQKHLIEFVRAGKEPSQLHNNCSGKHAGFLCSACHQEIETRGYVAASHPIQRQIKSVMEDLTGAQLGEDQCGTDGCSIPTYAVPLRGLAHGFARAATGNGLDRERAAAARRLMNACIVNGWFTAGTNRMCTRVMEAGDGAIFAKTGADGVYTAALPDKGLGIAIKCDDGSTPATETMLIATLSRVFADDDAMLMRLLPLARKTLESRKGDPVGEVRPVPFRY